MIQLHNLVRMHARSFLISLVLFNTIYQLGAMHARCLEMIQLLTLMA